ncbi:MAG TPA: hypothetical protein VM640_14240 [Desulfitobacterium sp.]|nr:hypothetical protein [Desulfitobacterium sp.]HVJ50260.1 hypothetical protein [Desulfitobacterium sp.]
MENCLDKELQSDEMRFSTVFLLDDFSASGISYLREEKLEWKGKVSKVLNRIVSLSLSEAKLFDLEEITICIVLYVATQKALNYLESIIDDWVKDHESKIKIQVLAIQTLGDEIPLNRETEKAVVEIVKRYYNPDIITSSYEKGDLTEPYLGFDGCALPIILSHNTPNNSLPILWFSYEKSTGLFPRVSRHT